jgi:hypothetical protein
MLEDRHCGGTAHPDVGCLTAHNHKVPAALVMREREREREREKERGRKRERVREKERVKEKEREIERKRER